jgi:hypothetical protein
VSSRAYRGFSLSGASSGLAAALLAVAVCRWLRIDSDREARDGLAPSNREPYPGSAHARACHPQGLWSQPAFAYGVGYAGVC